jgi:DNA polymerase-3 subunit chi
MTRIDFHVNTPDKIGYCCRLLRKIHRTGQKAVVFDPDPRSLAAMDRALWSFSELDFLPHVMIGDTLADETPILLAAEPVDSPHHDVLVNLGLALPAFFSRFERLVEIVGPDAEEVAQARVRWRHYKDRGYPIETYDLAAIPQSA